MGVSYDGVHHRFRRSGGALHKAMRTISEERGHVNSLAGSGIWHLCGMSCHVVNGTHAGDCGIRRLAGCMIHDRVIMSEGQFVPVHRCRDEGLESLLQDDCVKIVP